ncbi:MAG: hypothetical protein FVQ81_14235 [Candidatus Glassbacteria bacterium]|nr:hypothetical protein [Candidatus Glassbacteria bacterium]
MRHLSAILLVLCTVPHALSAQNAVTPGEFFTERPTLICLGFEWKITGDDNRNAKVAVSYRKAGDRDWQSGPPLLRLGGERVFSEDVYMDYTVPEMFAGSILDLEPGTDYECRLVMTDPDGVGGESGQTVTLRTRSEPQAFEGGRVLHVYPPGWDGPRESPAFTGLMKAYQGAGGGDWAVVSERTVQPGDMLLVHAGRYRSERSMYSDPLGLDFHGTYLLTAKGTPGRPITIRAAGDGEVIFDGAGCYRLFDMMAADWHIFEGITFRDCDVAIHAGTKDVAGCKGLAVKNCRFEEVGIAVTTQYDGSCDFYIADNVMLGRDDRNRLVGWYDPGVYGAAPLNSYYAVKVYGAGHVVCHNYIAFFHDAICVCTHGSPPAERARQASAIDFYNNDIHLMADDFIEADGGAHNIRILRNRCFNAAQCGLSAQPVFGGPAYFVRNILYHVPWGLAFKFKVKPAGLLVYHNTVIAESRSGETYSNAHFRNNLFLGTGSPGRELWRFPLATSYSSWDYNGYRPNRGTDTHFFWKAPAGGTLMDYTLDRADFTPFKDLAALRAATGQEAHGLSVDYDIFTNVTRPDPEQPHKVYSAKNFDFSLRKGGAAVDAGVVLPGINDSYSGKAPDLGALEAGAEAPVYGPRGNEK